MKLDVQSVPQVSNGQTWVVFPSNLQTFPSFALLEGSHWVATIFFWRGLWWEVTLLWCLEPPNGPLPIIFRVQHPSLRRALRTPTKNPEYI